MGETAWMAWAAAAPQVGDDFTREVMARLQGDGEHSQDEQLVARSEASE